MSYIDIFLIAVALSMDAFAVSVCQGLSLKKLNIKDILKAGIFYGGFQALMPLLGYLLGSTFAKYIKSFSSFIAFGLLAFIGINMIKPDDEGNEKKSMDLKSMLLFAVATSIDALAVGITFSFTNLSIWTSVLIIGIITFVISGIGIKLGSIVGSRYNRVANIVGGIVLILIGIKIAIEHLFF